MKLDPKDIPKEESLLYSDEYSVDYNKLIPVREKYTAKEISDFLVNHYYFKAKSFTENKKWDEDEILTFLNALKSLIVTWDQSALNEYESLMSQLPGNIVKEFISYNLIYSDFPDRKMLIDFAKKIKKRYPDSLKYFEQVIGSVEEYIRHKRPLKQWKKATPAEELRKKE